MKSALMRVLQSGREPTLRLLGRELALGARTTRRRLDQQGTTFMRILAEVRFDCASNDLLHTAFSIDEIALRLGFSNTSAFYKAFKRWSGTTPAEYRRMSRSRS